MRRRMVLVLLAGVPLLVLTGFAVNEYWPRDPPPPLPAPRSPVLPDLSMAPLSDLLGSITEEGHTQQIFFSASIANLGPGPFMINAVRGDERGGWRVSQRFRERDGSTTELATPADMAWGGHGHDHWHVRIGAAYALYTLPSMRKVRSLEKVGYCFFDQVPYDLDVDGGRRLPFFPKTGCNGKSTLALNMGLSPGWQDPYTWLLPDQRLDVTGLPDGNYRLVATADPNDWFRETNEGDNSSWVDVRLTTSSFPPRVAVLRKGPAR